MYCIMIQKFLQCRDGNFGTLTAILALPLLSAAALALHFTAANLEATKLQDSVNAAALGSLKAFAETASVPRAVQAAKALFGGSFKNEFAATPLDSSRNFAIDLDVVSSATKEVAEATYTTHFKPILLPWDGFDITRKSVAVRMKMLESCILALHPSAARSFNVTGASKVDLTECTVTANSTDRQAIYIGGAANFSAKCLISHGGVALQNPVSLSCDDPITEAPVVVDPFAGRKLPPKGPPRLNELGAVLLPGTYNGLTIGQKVLLSPGDYIIDGGKFLLTQDAELIGKGVTFFLINDAELDIHGAAVINVTPSTKGNWAGFIIVAEHGNTKRAVINGKSSSSMTGIVYLPDAKELQYSGGSATSGGCIRLIAQQITIVGNSKFSIDCSQRLAGNAIFTGGAIRLAK